LAELARLVARPTRDEMLTVPFARRLVRTGEVSRDRAADAIADLTDFDLHRHRHLDLLHRAWRLREHVTAYDAMYIALGQALDAPIVTCDAPLGRAPGHRTHIEVIA
jgi:predicted nucleic acid-binding protein